MAVKKRTKVFFGVGVAALAVVVVAVVGISVYFGRTQRPEFFTVADDGAADGKSLAIIRTHTRTDCGITPYLIADELGFFEEEGIKLEYTGTLSPDEIIVSVLSGDNDMADAHPNELALFVQQGAAVKGVSRDDLEPLDEANRDYRHMKYFVSENSPLKSWEDLKTYKPDRQITVNAFDPSCMTFVAGAIFDRLGIDRSRLKFVTFASDQEALQAVDQGNIDIAQVHPPFYKLAHDSGLYQLGDSFDAGLGAATGTALYYFTDAYIEEHPDRVQAFVNAITKAQIWANRPENRARAAEITGIALDVDVAQIHYYADNTAIIEEEIQPWLDDLVRGGYIEEGEVEISDMVTHRFHNPSITEASVE